MRYLALILGLAICAGCEMTPERQTTFRSNLDLYSCAHSLSSGSTSTTGDRPHIPYAQALQWCKAMQSGQPYTPPVNAAPTRIVQEPPSYACRQEGYQTVCRPR